MALTIKRIVTVSESFKTLIQRGNYEKIIVSLMNSSNILFPNEYKHITSQPSGECDFEDLLTHKKYDAKLLITTEQGKNVGSRNSDLLKWFKSMAEELGEFGEYIEKRGQIDVEKLTIYRIMQKQILSDKSDENIIFFFPYPVVLDLGENSITQFVGDILAIVFGELKKNGIIGEREIYVIYPAMDKKIVLRCLNNEKREYLENDLMQEYINYETQLVEV